MTPVVFTCLYDNRAKSSVIIICDCYHLQYNTVVKPLDMPVSLPVMKILYYRKKLCMSWSTKNMCKHCTHQVSLLCRQVLETTQVSLCPQVLETTKVSLCPQFLETTIFHSKKFISFSFDFTKQTKKICVTLTKTTHSNCINIRLVA